MLFFSNSGRQSSRIFRGGRHRLAAAFSEFYDCVRVVFRWAVRISLSRHGWIEAVGAFSRLFSTERRVVRRLNFGGPPSLVIFQLFPL